MLIIVLFEPLIIQPVIAAHVTWPGDHEASIIIRVVGRESTQLFIFIEVMIVGAGKRSLSSILFCNCKRLLPQLH